MLPHTVSDVFTLVCMETFAVVVLRFVLVELFGVDIFNFSTLGGQVAAVVVTVGTFVGIYRVLTSRETATELANKVVFGA